MQRSSSVATVSPDNEMTIDIAQQEKLFKAPNLEELDRLIEKTFEKSSVLTLRTYYLSDYGQKVLNFILKKILGHYDRMDLHDVIYTASKEIILNATKANLKRLLFGEVISGSPSPEEYEEAMKSFKEHLIETKIKEFKEKFIKNNYYVNATFYHSSDVINVKVKNNFPLYLQEERRIREKFSKAQEFSNLIDFYMQHGDETEGAGLGLTMVGILLEESGIDRHCFTISSNQYEETAAKLEIPLNESYIPKRKRFEKEFEESYLSLEAFREEFASPASK